MTTRKRTTPLFEARQEAARIADSLSACLERAERFGERVALLELGEARKIRDTAAALRDRLAGLDAAVPA